MKKIKPKKTNKNKIKIKINGVLGQEGKDFILENKIITIINDNLLPVETISYTK